MAFGDKFLLNPGSLGADVVLIAYRNWILHRSVPHVSQGFGPAVSTNGSRLSHRFRKERQRWAGLLAQRTAASHASSRVEMMIGDPTPKARSLAPPREPARRQMVVGITDPCVEAIHVALTCRLVCKMGRDEGLGRGEQSIGDCVRSTQCLARDPTLHQRELTLRHLQRGERSRDSGGRPCFASRTRRNAHLDEVGETLDQQRTRG